MLGGFTNNVSAMDQGSPYPGMMEPAPDFLTAQKPHEAQSRCCKAPTFRDGDHLICDRCRLVTKPVEAEVNC
jgi:hypothetical protein